MKVVGGCGDDDDGMLQVMITDGRDFGSGCNLAQGPGRLKGPQFYIS